MKSSPSLFYANAFIERLAARGYYVIATILLCIINCHQAPHRTVLAQLTHTAPH